jgi:TatD DNase family protein
MNLPAVIHSRLAADEILFGIKEEQFTCGGALHCFTEDWEFARQMLKHDFYISFSGILTFPQAHSLREVARRLPLEKLMVETDSPFLAPVPYRGKIKRNEPAYVTETLKYLADLKEVSFTEAAIRTTANFEKCFGFEI